MTLVVVTKTVTWPPGLNPFYVRNISRFGSPVLANVGLQLSPARIENTSVFGSHSIESAQQELLPAAIANASEFGQHALLWDQTLIQTTVGNASAFGAPTIAIAGAPIEVTNIGTGSANATTATITVPAGGVPEGALIFIGVCSEYSVGLSSISDSASNTYTRATKSTNLYLPLAEGWYCKNCKALAQSDTIVSHMATAVRQRITGMYAINVDTDSPLDVAVNARGSSSTPSLASGALAENNELVIGVVGTTSSRTMTQDADFTAPPAEENSIGTYSVYGGSRIMEEDTSSQTYNPTMNNSQNWAEVVVSFKKA